MEFSQVTQPGLRELYDAYSFAVIPRVGALVAGDAGSYQYLVESIRKFPDQVRSQRKRGRGTQVGQSLGAASRAPRFTHAVAREAILRSPGSSPVVGQPATATATTSSAHPIGPGLHVGGHSP